MRVTEASKLPNQYNLQKRPEPFPQQKALTRYEALSQILYDAVVPFISAYETQQPIHDEHHNIQIMVKLDDIMRAMKAISADVVV